MAIKYDSSALVARNLGEFNDCTVKALSICCDIPYKKAHQAMREAGRCNGRGANRIQQAAAYRAMGFEQHFVEFKGCTIKTVLKQLDPSKIYRVHIRGHVLAVRYGKIEDWTASDAKAQRRRIQEIWEITPKVSKNAKRKAARYAA